jgi:hypothetical protein
MSALSPGDLVVLPREPGVGVARLERILDVEGVPSGRIFLYEDGSFLIRPLADIAPCPPGVWDKKAPPAP